MAAEKLAEYIRLLKLTKKPDREEFTLVAKVAGAGILLIGMVGFVIYLLMVVLPAGLR
ncbi:MAG: protein translocase SEC61 complex subunit gamma [Euryarchaeota archaeon]|nr:protein translocase SEC61 complex subunit gamma [Euryarchaeota archaeon]